MRHLDEGTIHAWLDGELTVEDSAAAETHTAGCASCAAAVAEARGLIAASSRIVGYLDDAPVGGGVLPVSSQPGSRGGEAGADSTGWRRSWREWPLRAAAAVLLVAGGTAVVVQQASEGGSVVEVPAESGRASAGREPQSAEAAATGNTAAPIPSVTQQSAAPSTLAAAAPPPEAQPTLPGPTPTPPDAIALAEPVEQTSPAPGIVLRGRTPMRPGVGGERVASETVAAADAQLLSRDSAGARESRSFAASVAPERGVTSGATVPSSGGISGVVVNESTREPLNAVVTVAGTEALAVADSAGRFTVGDIPVGRRMLSARLIGYTPTTLPVDVRADTTASVQVELALDAMRLSEVVVTGGTPGTRDRPALVAAMRRCYALYMGDPAAGSMAADAAQYRRREEEGGRLPDGIRGFELEPTSDNAGEGQWHDARLLPSGMAARWQATNRGGIMVRWEIRDGTMVITLAPSGDGLRGTVMSLDRREEPRRVNAIEQRCDNRE